MVKYPNLYYMSSAFAPKYIPKAIMDYANTRGADRVMYASDYPLLGLSRCMQEAVNLPFRDQERSTVHLGQRTTVLQLNPIRSSLGFP